jgi:hypothetical protein
MNVDMIPIASPLSGFCKKLIIERPAAPSRLFAGKMREPDRRRTGRMTAFPFFQGDAPMANANLLAPPAESAPPVYRRHALGLPAGSVRAVLAIGVLGLLWYMAFTSKGSAKLPTEFVYLQMLMTLVLASFFASHGGTIGKHVSRSSPLGLPSGTMRFLLLGGYAGLTYFLFAHRENVEFEAEISLHVVHFLALILSAFFIGHVVTLLVRAFGGGTIPFWYQDLQAWASIVSLLGLAFLFVAHVINLNVRPDQQIGGVINVILAGIVAFYFGART